MKNLIHISIVAAAIGMVSCGKQEISQTTTCPKAVEAPGENSNRGGEDEEPIIIFGLVRSQSGGPLSGVDADLYEQDDLVTPIEERISNENGNYQIGSLAAASYVLKLSKSGYQTKTIPFTLPATGMTRTDTLIAQ